MPVNVSNASSTHSLLTISTTSSLFSSDAPAILAACSSVTTGLSTPIFNNPTVVSVTTSKFFLVFPSESNKSIVALVLILPSVLVYDISTESPPPLNVTVKSLGISPVTGSFTVSNTVCRPSITGAASL